MNHRATLVLGRLFLRFFLTRQTGASCFWYTWSWKSTKMYEHVHIIRTWLHPVVSIQIMYTFLCLIYNYIFSTCTPHLSAIVQGGRDGWHGLDQTVLWDAGVFQLWFFDFDFGLPCLDMKKMVVKCNLKAYFWFWIFGFHVVFLSKLCCGKSKTENGMNAVRWMYAMFRSWKATKKVEMFSFWNDCLAT